MKKQGLTNRILKSILSKNASSLFLNGCPGSGKSFLLQSLVSILPNEIPNVKVLGPYDVSLLENFLGQLFKDLLDYSYIDDLPENGILLNFVNAWNWLKTNLVLPQNEIAIILIDLNYNEITTLDQWRFWFSNFRYLQSLWGNDQKKISFLLTSYWDNDALVDYYGQNQESFPYTNAINYFLWEGVEIDQVEKIISNLIDNPEEKQIFSSLLFEITDGHPGAISDIISYLKFNPLTLENLIEASYLASQKGKYASCLVETWALLPMLSKQKLSKLLMFEPVPYLSSYADQMRAAGLVKQTWISEKCYISIKSFYVELVARQNAKIIGLDNADFLKKTTTEFVPNLLEINLQAYEIIAEIENLTRNYILAHLLNQNLNNTEEVLESKVFKFDKYVNQEIDLRDSAIEWKSRSVASTCSPLITFISTQDLSELIQESDWNGDKQNWIFIAESIDTLTDIRHAVMHNQIINDSVLGRLYTLRQKIFEAMS